MISLSTKSSSDATWSLEQNKHNRNVIIKRNNMIMSIKRSDHEVSKYEAMQLLFKEMYLEGEELHDAKEKLNRGRRSNRYA